MIFPLLAALAITQGGPQDAAKIDWLKKHSTVVRTIDPNDGDFADLEPVGKAIGDSRVVCGVHFQSDVEAGRVIGSAMVARLHADPQFQADLARAKAELAKAPAAAGLSCPAA